MADVRIPTFVGRHRSCDRPLFGPLADHDTSLPVTQQAFDFVLGSTQA